VGGIQAEKTYEEKRLTSAMRSNNPIRGSRGGFARQITKHQEKVDPR